MQLQERIILPRREQAGFFIRLESPQTGYDDSESRCIEICMALSRYILPNVPFATRIQHLSVSPRLCASSKDNVKKC